MIVRYDGTKIFPIEIEVALLKCPCVRACAAVGATDPLHPQSGVPIVYVVLQDSNQIELLFHSIAKIIFLFIFVLKE